jgi:hypothetical protein
MRNGEIRPRDDAPVSKTRNYIQILSVLLALSTLAGCQSGVDDRPVVATSWAGADCARIEADFDHWLSSRDKHSAAARRPGIRWVRLSPGDDLEQFARKRRGVDVLLGGAVESYRLIEAAGLLAPAQPQGESRRLTIQSPGRGNHFPGVYFKKLTPRFLDFARTELSRNAWASGYERLLRLTEQGERGIRVETERAAKDGAAIVAGARHRDAAIDLMAFLIERRAAKPAPPDAPADPAFDGLLADLLRATLFDSRDELETAWIELAHHHSDQLIHFLIEPPPWPPASVAMIQVRGDGQAMIMIETLAGQIAPDPRSRSWLLRSWLSPPRRVEGDFLEELSRAEEGRLAREPRFRAWLRAEWTAWARQRYRRVARQARSSRSIVEVNTSQFGRP